MAIIKEIDVDLVKAMKEKSETALGVLRMLRSAFKYKAIEKQQQELSEDEAVSVLKGEIKKRLESVEVYTKGGRNDLADKEKAEIEILEKYMPAQMSAEEIKSKATSIFETMDESEKGNFGLVMKKVMAELGSGADGKVVSQVIRDILQK